MSKLFKTLNFDEDTLLVVASSTVTYIGKACIGSATSAAVWKVARLTSNAGGDLSVGWAGTGVYDQVWDNRASLIYTQ